MTRYRRKFHRIARKLTNLELQQGAPDNTLTIEGVLNDLEQSRGSDYFLGSYSKDGIMLALEKFSIRKELHQRGFHDLSLNTDTSDPYRQLLRLYFEQQDPEHLLGELVLHKATFTKKGDELLPEQFYPLTVLHVEWLVLQDPTSDFSGERPRLPGQDHPGLGVGAQVLEMLYLTAKHQRTDGLLIVPHYYHTARIFSEEFRFINPEYQALLHCLIRDLDEYPLPIQAWAVECGAVRYESDNSQFHWQPEEQLLPCRRPLKEYLKSDYYLESVAKAKSNYSFLLDTQHLQYRIPDDVRLEV